MDASHAVIYALFKSNFCSINFVCGSHLKFEQENVHFKCPENTLIQLKCCLFFLFGTET